MAMIMMIMPDGSIQEHRFIMIDGGIQELHVHAKAVHQASPAEVFAWVGDQITMRRAMEIGEAVLIAKTAEGWRVHGPIDYRSLIDRLETVSKEAAGDGK